METVTHFKAGDRVEIIDDIGHQYQSHVGIVMKTQQRAMAVVEEVDVHLADGTAQRFFDFQLRTPPAKPAPVIFDSTMAQEVVGTRGNTDCRHLQFEAEGLGLHIRVTAKRRAIQGQVTSSQKFPEQPLVTLLVDDQPQQDTTADGIGEFAFDEVPLGNVTVEIFMPGRRIVAPIGQ
jgi:hypothetical protein